MKGRTTMIRPAPWPLYDTEKVARWLEKMARQGFVLTEHGFPGTLPLAIFQKTNRQNLQKNAPWSENQSASLICNPE